MNAVNEELLSALEAMLEQGERMNRAFFVSGKSKDCMKAMDGQKHLLARARVAIANAKAAEPIDSDSDEGYNTTALLHIQMRD